MTDTEQVAYDATKVEIEQFKDEWCEFAVRLMIIERAHRRIEGDTE